MSSIGSVASKSFKYIRLSIVAQNAGVAIDQQEYISTLHPIEIGRIQATAKGKGLTDSETREYRALVGQLNWNATQIRPDIAFDVCALSSACNKATVGDVCLMNKVVSRVHSNCVRLYFHKLESLEECTLECYADAAFANLNNSGAQGCFIIFLQDARQNRCPIYWETKKVTRVVKSTLLAETMALLDCAETA